MEKKHLQEHYTEQEPTFELGHHVEGGLSAEDGTSFYPLTKAVSWGQPFFLLSWFLIFVMSGAGEQQ